MFWCMLAEASSEVEELREVAAAIGAEPSGFEGTLFYQGHGRVPGAVEALPITVELRASCATWKGEGWTDHVTWDARGVVWEGDPAEKAARPERAMIEALAPTPGALLRWLAARPEHLRRVGDDWLVGLPEGLATLELGAHGPTGLSWEHLHPVFGDVESSVRWNADGVELDLTEADTRWRAALRPTNVPVDTPCEHPHPALVTSTPLAPSLFALEVPSADARSLLAVVGEEGVLFDAPLSSAIGQALLDEARRLAPSVKHFTVVVSHHHPHYTGGLRPWVRAGSTLVAHQALVPWLTETLARDRTGDPGVRAAIVPVKRKLSLLGGAVRLQAIDGASGHTDAFVLSMIEGEEPTVYAADLTVFSDGEARFRGTWPTELGRWKPTWVVSAFPLSGQARFPFSALERP